MLSEKIRGRFVSEIWIRLDPRPVSVRSICIPDASMTLSMKQVGESNKTDDIASREG